MSVIVFFLIYNKGAFSLINRKDSKLFTSLFAALIILFLGLRPISYVFVDMTTYNHLYHQLQVGDYPASFMESDVLFASFMLLCSQHMSAQSFFLIVEVLYILPVYWACRRWVDGNADIMMLFFYAAFSFYTYGVNGIRNGMALSCVILALSYLKPSMKFKNWLVFLLLSTIAILSHKSSLLPIVCALASIFIKNPKFFFQFWLLAILLSLVSGNFWGEFFGSLGFDDRLSYLTNEADDQMFSKVGFRWDFLIYSCMPILLGWYLIYKRKVVSSTYNLLLGTYILANAFWILVIRAEYSNRFAYLSWFLYPIVLSFPLLKIPIWKTTQGKKLSVIMLAHLGFTLLMWFM